MKESIANKSIFNFLERLNFKVQSLSFRFPIETLDELLKRFYKEHDYSAFLVQANKNVTNLTLNKITNSYLLKVPIHNQSNEHLYIGLSDVLSFMVVFDEPDPEKQNVKEQKSNFFLTFDPAVINTTFNFFYKNYCKLLTVKEKKLLIKLKNIKNTELNPHYISKFQEALLINTLNDNNKTKREKIVEAFSFTDDSIIITDISGSIKEANKNFEKSFGSKYQSIREILSQVMLDEAVREASRSRAWHAEINLKTATGKTELMIVSCNLFKDELKRPNGFVYSFKNVTELKKLDNINKQLIAKLRESNLQLSDVNKRLIDADRIKTDLLSVVSHELKTPISSIIGFSELIAHRDYDEKTIHDFAQQITEAAKNLDRLVTDYLDVASNQFGIASDKLHTMPVNLAELVRLSYREQELKFGKMKFQLELNCLGFEPVIITETQNVKKLFDNLLNNSMKYSPDGGKILVKILNDGETVTLSVADQGIGMTFEQAQHVFEPFYRADNSVTREFTGIGLGLAVCKKIVELYNGSIWCEPGIDMGTVFYLTLPVNPHVAKKEAAIKNQDIKKSIEQDVKR